MASNITIQVEPSVLTRTAHTVRSLAHALRQDFTAIEHTVNRTRYYWVGPAGDKTREEFVEQKSETDELLALLAKYPQDLLEMAGLYETGEKNVSEIAAALPSSFLD